MFGGGSSEVKGPVKYFMPPFNNNWSNSIFMSLDPVAIESVGYDFLRSEFDGVHKHDAVNNEWEAIPICLVSMIICTRLPIVPIGQKV